MLPCWVVKQNSQKRLAPLVKSCPKRPTGSSVSVEESGPVRADEFDLEGVDEFGPTDADEDVVPAPILPSKAEAESHNVSHLPFRSWCSASVRGPGLSLGHRKVDTKTKEAEQIQTVSVDYGLFGQPEDRSHDTLPVLIVRDRKSKGVWSYPVPVEGCDAPVSCKGPDGRP